MAYTRTFAVNLGSSQTGLTLEAQLVDTTGANVGSAVTTGFVEIGGGSYLWHYASFPDGHRGGVIFRLSGGGAFKAFASINPELGEYTDAKTTTVLSRLPAVLVSGRIDASVGAMAAGVVTASAIASAAITSAKFAAGAIDAAAVATGAIDADALAADAVAEILTTQMTESYAADGVAPTLAQAVFLIMQRLTEFSISSTTVTIKKLDGSTTAATLTLDSATAPTSSTRSG